MGPFFVDHLAILRLEAFQNGEGEVFLISLKAGGTGLNLNAADYVLHMDPWWNPAVEDQAADRAHRMGQLRPITIYRFITRGTIEDKILELQAPNAIWPTACWKAPTPQAASQPKNC